MRIGITDTINEDKYEHYVEWIRSMDESVNIIQLSHQNSNHADVAELDGIILTGGGDVHPRFYGKENQLYKTKGVNEARDEFEFNLIEKAINVNLPILGICRGMQIMNVYLGGSLFIDLESEGFDIHTNDSDDRTIMHNIDVEPDTLMHALVETESIEVNSFHHQGVEKLGRGLICSAVSSDGVVEGAEWALKDNMPFLMLAQWHPERMKESFLSQKIARIFLREVRYTKSIK